jgi:hypothetical protein
MISARPVTAANGPDSLCSPPPGGDVVNFTEILAKGVDFLAKVNDYSFSE